MSKFFLFMIFLFTIGAAVSAVVAIFRYFSQKNVFYSLATFIIGSVLSLSMLLSIIAMYTTVSSYTTKITESYDCISGFFTYMFSSQFFLLLFSGAYFTLFKYAISVANDMSPDSKASKNKIISLLIFSFVNLIVPLTIWLLRF